MKGQANLTLPKIDSKIRRSIHQDLPLWYQQNQRPLPWRLLPSPYRTVVSEFMCQQTQIATVLPYFARWLAAFPDWASLAAAPEDKVLKHWEGLGYYRRARNLHALARSIMTQHAGKLPSTLTELLALPGIGPYTAGAIASISFQQNVPVLDGNIERVLTRVFALTHDITKPSTKKLLWALAEKLLPQKNPGDHNQSLMELGALVCTPAKPQCLLCPLKKICQAPEPTHFPVKTKTISIQENEKVCLIIQNKKIWLSQPSTPGRWPGFYRLPRLHTKQMQPLQHLGTHRYAITKYRVTAEVYLASWKKNPPHGFWANAAQLEKISLPAPHRKMIALLLHHHNSVTFF
jgi:A/G-specific adenine glycosylase